MNSGPLLHTADLPSPLQNQLGLFRAEQRTMAATALDGPSSSSGDVEVGEPAPRPVVMPLCEIEKRAILEALAYTKGDHTTAAQLLGIGRTTLYRKLKEYRLLGPESKPPGSAGFANPLPKASNG